MSPLVARPFLRKTCKYVVNTTVYFSEPDPTKNLTFDRKSGFWALKTTEHKRDNESDVMYAYWIVALCHVSQCVFYTNIPIFIEGVFRTLQNMKLFANIVNGWKPLIILQKALSSDVYQGSEYASVYLVDKRPKLNVMKSLTWWPGGCMNVLLGLSCVRMCPLGDVWY